MKRRRTNAETNTKGPATRCAIYTRKSSEEGLQQEFNSLDAQREAAEAYIASQKAEGWRCLPERYDDGGYTGGNMERPALHRLMADIRAGKVDCVVVYKVDRLSRSLLDFARMMETFDQHSVAFVSVTQQFNTATSMGRLILNVLLSFAQFEREIIGERIRDKKAAACRKGKWPGGVPVLGYDVDRSSGDPKLVVNPAEATRVRQIFEMYLEYGSLLPLVKELEHRRWRTKEWTTRACQRRGGRPYDRCNVWNLLTNPIYIGKVKHKKDVYDGQHEAIVPEDLFRRTQAQLQQNARSGSSEFRNRGGALLRRLLYCKACGRVMAHTFTSRGSKRYRYYTCTQAIKSGFGSCPTKSLPAAEIEQAVVDQIRCIGRDPELRRETLRQARVQTETGLERLAAERRILERGLTRCHAELRHAAAGEPVTSAAAARIADLHDQVHQTETRLTEIAAQTAELQRDLVSEQDLATAFADFDSIWRALSTREQGRIIQLLVSRVEFDPAESTIEVSFYPSGIKALARKAMEDAA